MELRVVSSLKLELNKLKKDYFDQSVELVKVAEALEKVKEEAVITYEDCVTNFQGSFKYWRRRRGYTMRRVVMIV